MEELLVAMVRSAWRVFVGLINLYLTFLLAALICGAVAAIFENHKTPGVLALIFLVVWFAKKAAKTRKK